MADAASHVAYYTEQEKKRDKIMQDKLESQKKRFANYKFLKQYKNHFFIFEKENYTQDDEDNGMSYRIDFYIGSQTCSTFVKKERIEKACDEIESRFRRNS